MTIDEQQHVRLRHDVADGLAKRLRTTRSLRGLTQEGVALAAGLSVQQYSALERGRVPSGRVANPTLDTLIRVFTVLRYDPRRLPDAAPLLRPATPAIQDNHADQGPLTQP
jgi:transcriptional regulator with XRE-family HTH domain